MYLRRLKETLQKISFKLFFLYAVIFIASAIFLFAGSYLLLLSSLKEQDHNDIKTEARSIALLFKQGKTELIESRLAMARKFEAPERYFMRIADSDNKTILMRLPYQWASFQIKELEVARPQEGAWRTLKAEGGTATLEVYTFLLDQHFWIQVGKTTQGRDRILQRFKEVSSLILLCLLAVGSMGGLFLSHRALRPVRQLVSLIRSLDIRDLKGRVPEPSSRDEIRDLVVLFNGLLDRISDLINAMKKSLDSVAHDLRTPITRMRGTAEMALCSECGPDVLREALSDCVEESEKVLKLLNAIMDIAEAEAGAMRLRKEPVSIPQLLGPIAELYGPVAEEKKVLIRVELPQDLSVVGDRVRLSQAMANLLDNAIKYTEENTTVHIRAINKGDVVQIVFEDQGPGLQLEDEQKIWTWFYRSDAAKEKRGLGIGLATVKAIVEAHQGRVRAESLDGGGSRFVVELPLFPEGSS